MRYILPCIIALAPIAAGSAEQEPLEAVRAALSQVCGSARASKTGIEPLALQILGDRAVVRLSREARVLARDDALHDALLLRLLVLLHDRGVRHLRLEVPGDSGGFVDLDELARLPSRSRPPAADPDAWRESKARLSAARVLAPPAAFPFDGALSGRTIFLSPGHGYYWNSSIGWTTQRGLVNDLIEDIHNNEIVMAYLAPMLEHAGARVISCRERSRNELEIVADDGDGEPFYTESGSGWREGAETGFKGGYRVHEAGPDISAEATWHLPVLEPGSHPVYVAYRAGTNRAVDAAYTVHHAGGATTVHVDQTLDDRRWVYIGEYWFEPDGSASISLSAASSESGYVVADTVRLGGGMGTLERGGGPSGKAKWKEAARYWIQYSGAPASVYDARNEDNGDDVVARPLYADWRGGDLFFSHHTNAGGGTGTSTFIHDTSPSPGSAELQAAVHDKVIRDLRALWRSDWYDRGKKSANFGEVREVNGMPAMLIESAFHDLPEDAAFIHNPRWRRDLSRAIAKGIQDYLAPGTPYPPLPPTHLRVTDIGGGSALLAWKEALDPLEPSAAPTGYRVYISTHGRAFDNGDILTSSPSVTIDDLEPGTVYYFRVTAVNQGGESLPGPVVSVRPRPDIEGPRILLVDGFDRLDRYVREYDNTFDFAKEHATALAEAGAYFDMTSNEAISDGLVDLSRYVAIDWFLGEESTADSTLDADERSAVRAYLDGGGALLISGAEIGWTWWKKAMQRPLHSSRTC